MKRTYILLGLFLAVVIGGSTVWNLYAGQASAQKSDENFGIVSQYNARDEFSNTQNPNGVWSYGYSTSDADNTLNLFTFPNDSLTSAGCGGGVFEAWRINNGDQIPQITRHNPAVTCLNIPANALFVHPGYNDQRAVTRWTAPAGGTFQITGSFQKQNASATTDLKIIKNAAIAGETTLFTATLGAVSQQTFNFTASVSAGETLDFSVGDDGNNSWQSDGSSIVINIGQPVTACIPAPANLQVFAPGENSPSDVQSVNTNASLAGDAAFTNAGKVGRAFELDGSGDYVRIEDNAAQRPATALTAEGWFKFDNASGIVSLISKPVRNSPLNSYTLYLENGQLRGLIGNSSQFTRAFSSFAPQTGVWHHLAFTYDFSGGISTLKLYANGAEVTSGVDGTANLPLYYDANPFPLLIGGEFENNAPGFFLDGLADEVSVYGRALPQAEIFEIVRRGSFGKCPPAVCAQTPSNLVSWFAGEQNALDSRSNNHGILQNGATFSSGRVGQAFSLDGVDDFVAAPDANSLDITGDLTIEAWVNPAQIQAGSATLVDKRDPSNTNLNYVLFLVNGELRFASRSNGGVFDENFSGVTLTAGTLSHVAVTIQNGALRFYVNGVSSPALTAPATRSASTGRLIIGATETTSLSGFFNGSIDELSIYSRALTAAEISSIYSAGQSGKCKPVAANPTTNQVAWFTGDGDTRDFTGLNPDGVLQGNTSYAVGKVGQSFNLDGNGDYVEVPDDSDQRPANDVTVEGWFNVRSISDSHFVSKPLVGSNSNSYVVWYDGGVMRAGHGDQSGNFETLSTTFSPNLNTWYHFAYTLDDANNVHRFYINGVEIASAASTLPLFYDANPRPLLIGAEFGPPGTPYSFVDGRMDEISLYSRALSPSEVAAVYSAGAAGKLKSKPVNVLPPLSNRSKAAKNADLLAPATVQLSDATVTFANVTSSGTVSENGIDLGSLPALPSSVTFTGLAYDISTTAGYQQGSADDVQVCFNVPALANFTFADLRILHLENGVWVNRSAAGGTSPNICTDNLTSLSPFAIVQALAPTAANVTVSGRVADASGKALGGVSVSLTDSQGRSVHTKSNNFGRYSFTAVAAGEVYIVSVHSKRYTFAVSSQAVNVQDAVENVDFTADYGALREERRPIR